MKDTKKPIFSKNHKSKLKSIFKDYKIPMILIFAILIIGILITTIIVNSSAPSNASNDGWLAFIGGILGSIISFVAAMSILTISQQKETERSYDNQRISMLPFLRFIETNITKHNDSTPGFYISPFKETPTLLIVEAKIANIGLGTLCNLESVDAFQTSENSSKIPLKFASIRSTKNLLIPPSIDLLSDSQKTIHIRIHSNKIDSDIATRTFEFTLSFCDLLNNKYYQSYRLSWNEANPYDFSAEITNLDSPQLIKNM